MPTLKDRMTLDGFDLLDPAALFDQVEAAGGDTTKFWGKANSYRVQSGRESGIGYVLVSGTFFQSPTNLLSLSHTLIISDGQRTVTIPKLAIITAEAIFSNNPSDDKAAYLLTLVDARYFARDTLADLDFGLIKYNGGVDSDTPQDPIPQVFNGLVGLMGSLKVQDVITDFMNDLEVEMMLPASGSAWDGFLSVVDTFGLMFSIRNDGTPFLWCEPTRPDITDAIDDNDALQQDAVGHLLSWADHHVPAPIPEKITVVCRYRDYQWWTDHNRHTPQDHHRRFKSYEKTFDTQPDVFTDNEDRIVPATNRVIWAPFSLLTDDSGNDVDKAGLDETLRQFYQQHLTCIELGQSWSEFEYSGIWPFEAVGLSAVRWSDFGDGIKTKIWDTPLELPFHFNEAIPSWDQRLVSPGVPIFARDSHPHSRHGYATCLGKYPVSQNAEPVGPNEAAEVFLRSGMINTVEDEIEWTEREQFKAYNATEATIEPGAFTKLDYNYQLGTHGVWLITAHFTEGHFVGRVIRQIPAGTFSVTASGLFGNPNGAPGSTLLPNVRLMQLDDNGNYIDCLDAQGNPIDIIALNTCFIPAEVDDICQGDLAKGHWWLTVLCCPV